MSTWNGAAANGKWNDAGNWSAGIPNSGVAAVFDGTSGADCNLTDAAMTCLTLTITAAYTGTFDTNSQTLWVYGDASFDNSGAGALVWDNIVYIAGNLAITANWTSFTPTGSTLRMIDAAGDSTITSNGNVFADVVHDDQLGGWKVSLADAFSCATFDNVSGGWDSNGQTFASAGAISFAEAGGTEALVIDGAITQTGDANFTINGDFNAYTLTGSLSLQGTGNLAITPAYAGNIECAYNTKTTTVTVTLTMGNAVLTCNNAGGTLAITTASWIQLLPTTETDPFIPNGASISIAGGKFFIIDISGAITVNVPAVTTTGGGWFLIGNEHNSDTVTVNINGALDIAGILSFQTRPSNNANFVVNTNNNSLTAPTAYWGSRDGDSTVTINLGSSACDFNLFNTTLYNTGPLVINYGSSASTVSGDYLIGSNCTVNRGTATITLDGAGAQAITSAGERLPAITVTNTGGITSTADPLTCDGFNNTDGEIDQNGQAWIIYGSCLFDSDDDLTLDAALTIAAAGDFHIGSTVGTITVSSCNLVLQDTGNLDLDKATVFNNLTLAATGKITTITNGNSLSGAGNVLTIGAGTLTINARLALVVKNGQNTPLVVDGAATINGNNSLLIYHTIVDTVTTNIPAMTLTGTAYVRCYRDNTGIWTIDLQGAYSSLQDFFIYAGGAGNSVTFNTNNNDMTCGDDFAIGTPSGSTTVIANFGSSTMDIVDFLDNSYDAGTFNCNMDSSTWLVSGVWTMGANTILDPGTATITLDGAGAQAVTCAGQTLPAMTIANTGGTVTWQDTAALVSLNVTDGNLDFNGQATTLSGLFTWNSADTLTYDGALTITGNADFTIENVGTVNVTSTADLQGSGNLAIHKAALVFTSITCSASGKTTTWTGTGGGFGPLVCDAAGVFTATEDLTLTGDTTFGRFPIDPGTTITFDNTAAYTLTTYTPGDWDGTLGNLVTLQSDAGGSAWSLINPALMDLNYVDVSDSDAGGGNDINALILNGCVDSGGNSAEWIFTLPVPGGAGIGPSINTGVSIV